jgi:hypothetical protein
MSSDHGLIFSPCEVSRSARVTTVHSPKSVLIIRMEWTLNFLNYATFPCFTNSSVLSLICSCLSGSRSASSGFPCGLPWPSLNNKLIFPTWTIVGGLLLRGGPTSNSLGTHLHEVAREYLYKRWSARSERNWTEVKQGQRHPVGHCPVQLDFVRVGVSGKSLKNQLPRVRFKLCRYVLDHQRNWIAKYEP